MRTTHESQQLDPSVFEGFEGLTAIQELRRTLELEVKGKPVRIEVWHCHSNPNAPWVARVPTFSEFPWVDERDEEAAIRTALSFIEERTR